MNNLCAQISAHFLYLTEQIEDEYMRENYTMHEKPKVLVSRPALKEQTNSTALQRPTQTVATLNTCKPSGKIDGGTKMKTRVKVNVKSNKSPRNKKGSSGARKLWTAKDVLDLVFSITYTSHEPTPHNILSCLCTDRVVNFSYLFASIRLAIAGVKISSKRS